MTEPTVFIVDDLPENRASLEALVESMGLKSESYPSGESFLENFDRQQPGCLVTDIVMPGGMSGIELQARLAQEEVPLPVIVISAHAETEITVKAMQQGALTLLDKPYDSRELEEMVRRAIELDAAQRQSQAVKDGVRQRLAQLTPSEREVLDLMVAGCANKVIASRLGVSIRTVETRRHNIFEKLGAKSVAELVRMLLAVEPHQAFNYNDSKNGPQE